MTLAFLENQLASALTLQSAQEYRYWLLIYARFLVNEGTKLSDEGKNIRFEYCRCVLIENEKWWKLKQPRCFQKIWTQLSDWTGGNCRKASLHSVICSTQALYKQLLYFIYFSVSGSEYRLRELCKELLGPVHKSAATSWEPTTLVRLQKSVSSSLFCLLTWSKVHCYLLSKPVGILTAFISIVTTKCDMKHSFY